MADENSVSFKFHVRLTSAFSIKYKDKNDLYKKFLKKAKRHGFPVKGKFYGSNLDGDIRVIRNADELLATLEDHYKQKSTFRARQV
ncbi:unnamed protein product [Cylicostephanus goldi]|uniref:Uncharacterized protein n=1 Tax=Cylicostephanus goldi TaxID=71465 RepID=A0A3P6QZ06_CYLGO|nr:unnamed protein product [Cylicostephanus goldi]